MAESKTRICNRCVMDTTDPEIVFDDNGYCNHCNEYFRLEPFYVPAGSDREQKLKSLVENIKKDCRSLEYDCVIGLSGGVDSSFVAYQAKKLGLRALTVHFDNGWNSEQAVMNIENIVKKLGYDYQTWVVDWEEFRDLQLSFLKASVANAEIPTDHAFLAALYRICDQHNIRYVLSGSNFVTEGILPKSWGYNAKDIRHLRAIHARFGSVPLKTYPTLGIWKELYYTYVKKIRMIRLLNYVDYVKHDAMKILESELGWKYYGGKHYESVFTRFFQSYILPVKFNIDKRKAHLSTLICSGQITRVQAMEELKKPPYPSEKLRDEKEYVAKKFGITENALDAIIHASPKTYRDYPNNEALLKFIYHIYYYMKR